MTRILARYVKKGSPAIEVCTNTLPSTSIKDYFITFDGHIIDSHNVGDLIGIKLCELFIAKKRRDGYVPTQTN